MLTDLFTSSLQKLYKKHKNARSDVMDILDEVETHPGRGDVIPGLGAPLYKLRGALKSEGIGKSGGLRLIYYYRPPGLFLLYIYSKKMMTNHPAKEIMRWLKDNSF